MRFRPYGLAGALLATLTAGLLAQAQTPKPTFPTGAPVPGIPEPQTPGPTPTPAPATGIIRGRVLRLDNGQPLGKVRVDIRATGVRDLPVTTTDEKGQYELKALPAARYTLSAYKGGFVTLEYGQRRPNEPGRPVELAAGEVLDRIDFSLPSGGVIAGHVLDDAGEPMAGAIVQALRPRYVKGVRQLSAGPSRDITDDLGQFRLFGLAPGGYVLSATASDGRAEVIRLASANAVGSVATYYPGTPIATDARLVTSGGRNRGLWTVLCHRSPASGGDHRHGSDLGRESPRGSHAVAGAISRGGDIQSRRDREARRKLFDPEPAARSLHPQRAPASAERSARDGRRRRSSTPM